MICRIPIRDMTQSARPNQSCMFPYRKIDIEKIFYLSFSTNIQNHFPEIFILQNLILRTRSCGTGFITQCSWFFHFHLTTLVRRSCFVPQLYHFRRDISGGPAIKYFYIIHRGGQWYRIARNISSIQFSFIFKSDWGLDPYDARPLLISSVQFNSHLRVEF